MSRIGSLERDFHEKFGEICPFQGIRRSWGQKRGLKPEAKAGQGLADLEAEPCEDRCQVGPQETTLLRALLEPSKVGHLGGASSQHVLLKPYAAFTRRCDLVRSGEEIR